MTGKRVGKILGGLFAIVFGFLLAICTFYEPVFTRNSEAYYRLPVTLADSPKIVKASRRPEDLVFRFREFPGVYFGAQHRFFSSNYPKNLHAGDTATIIVLKREYRRAILKEGNIFERMVSARPDLYGFIKNGRNFINIDKISEDYLNPIIVYIVVGVMSIALIVGGVKTIFKNR